MIPVLCKEEEEEFWQCSMCLEGHETYAEAESCCKQLVEKPLDMTGCYMEKAELKPQALDMLTKPSVAAVFGKEYVYEK